jgi:ABC-type multidrug transport system fused ATPase/permease subunit
MNDALPRTLAGYIWRFSGRHQLVLCALSVVVFAPSAVPLELQRRIVNDAIDAGKWSAIAWLAAAYAAVALAEGGIKLVMNIYRAWVSENAVRHLRNLALASAEGPSVAESGMEGVELAMVLSEVEPVGGFIGSSTSEPVLQGGILAAVFGYMLYLEPWLAGLCFLVFSPQFVFVPLLQAAINRRVEKRVLTMRGISDGIIGNNGAGDAQRRRVDEVFALHMGMFKLKFSMNFLMNFTHHAGVAAALALGGWYVLRGHIELGTVVAFISGLAKVNDPWGDVVNWFRDMTVNRVKYRLLVDALRRMSGLDVGQKPLRVAV